MALYTPGQPVLTYRNELSFDRVHTDIPEFEAGLVGNVQRTTDPAISRLVVDLIAVCLDPSATDSRSYVLRVDTVNGNVSIVGSTGSSSVRDAYRKCLGRLKAEINGIKGITDVGVVHASDPKPQRGDGLMDTTAGLMDWKLGTLLSPTCTIRVDHADNVIYIRGSVPNKQDYEHVASLEKELPMFPHASRLDISGVLCSREKKSSLI